MVSSKDAIAVAKFDAGNRTFVARLNWGCARGGGEIWLHHSHRYFVIGLSDLYQIREIRGFVALM